MHLSFISLISKTGPPYITSKSPFNNRKYSFNKVSSSVNGFIKITGHLLPEHPTYVGCFPVPNWNVGDSMNLFTDLMVNCFRIVSPVENIVIS